MVRGNLNLKSNSMTEKEVTREKTSTVVISAQTENDYVFLATASILAMSNCDINKSVVFF